MTKIKFAAFRNVPEPIRQSVITLNLWILQDEAEYLPAEMHRLKRYLQARWRGDGDAGLTPLPLPRNKTLVETLSDIVDFTVDARDQDALLQDISISVIRDYVCQSILKAAEHWRIPGGSESLFEVMNLGERLSESLLRMPVVKDAERSGNLGDWDDCSGPGFYNSFKSISLRCLKAVASSTPNLNHNLTARQVAIVLVQMAKTIRDQFNEDDLFDRKSAYASLIHSIGDKFFKYLNDDVLAEKLCGSLDPDTGQQLGMALFVWAANSNEAHTQLTVQSLSLYDALVHTFEIDPNYEEAQQTDRNFNFAQAIELTAALGQVLGQPPSLPEKTPDVPPAAKVEELGATQKFTSLIELIELVDKMSDAKASVKPAAAPEHKEETPDHALIPAGTI